MTTLLPILGIDARLIGQQRTGDAVVATALTRSLLQIRGTLRYRLYTHVVEPARLEWLRHELGCVGRDDVEIVPLRSGGNRFLWNMVVLPWELWRRPVALFHTQYIAPLFWRAPTKLVIHIHDVSFAAHPEWIAWSDRFFLRLLIPRSLRRATRLVVPSRFTLREMEHYFPFCAGKGVVVPNAADPKWLVPVSLAEREAVRQKYQLPKRFIIATGTMQPRKNIALLIEAWRSRPAELQDVGLALTGNRAGHHVDAGVTDAVSQGILFTGYVTDDELRGIVAQATVLAFPSLYEGFGIPLLEAFAVGTPVWAARIDPFLEVGGEAFLSFDPRSLDEARKTLYTLLVDTDLCQRLTDAGRQRVELFSWDRSAVLMHTMYEQLLEHGHS